MRRLLALLLCIPCLLLGGCEAAQNSGAEAGTAVESFSEAEQLVLTETAQLLTKAITRSTAGFAMFPTDEPVQLAPPSAERPASLDQFLYLLVVEQSGGYARTPYAQWIFRDDEGVYHIAAEGASTILQEVFDTAQWDAAASNFVYDAAADEYTSALEFGVGYGWMCGEILQTRIAPDQRQVVVEYRAESLFPEASGREDEITAYLCRSSFDICTRENGEHYLRLVSVQASSN